MIIPALDVLDGCIVRLYQGDYNKKHHYDHDPLPRLKEYENNGAALLHLVDLTGAKNPGKRQISLLKNLLYHTKIPIQVGGGVRTGDDVSSILMAGAYRVVVSSTAVKQPEEVKHWFCEFGSEKIVLALDIRIVNQDRKEVAINGWQETSHITLEELIYFYKEVGIKHVLCTDILRDGTMQGSNIELYKEISNKFPYIALQASGGIGSLNDIFLLKDTGIKGVIVGRALLENKFTLSEAISCWQKE